MKEQKYKIGQRVKYVNYGSICYDLENMVQIDFNQELVGEEGTIVGSYNDLYGHTSFSNDRKYNKYCVNWDKQGRISWFELNQLEAI